MKLQHIGIIVMLLVFASCGTKKAAVKTTTETKSTPKSATVSYKSLGNDLAVISLQFFENNTFHFKMNGFGDEEEDAKPITISEKGKYTSDGKWKTLTFSNIKFDLKAVFDPQFASKDAFEVLDLKTVKINTAKEALPIWGVLCERE